LLIFAKHLLVAAIGEAGALSRGHPGFIRLLDREPPYPPSRPQGLLLRELGVCHRAAGVHSGLGGTVTTIGAWVATEPAGAITSAGTRASARGGLDRWPQDLPISHLRKLATHSSSAACAVAVAARARKKVATCIFIRATYVPVALVHRTFQASSVV